MNIRSRIKKLENEIGEVNPEIQEPVVCEHPPSMINLRRDYPAYGYEDRRLVVMGHCNACGADDFIWSHFALTEEQEARRSELIDGSHFWAHQAFDLELLNAGLIKYTLYPPSQEVQRRLTGKVTI